MHYRLLKDRRRRILSSVFETRRVILRSLIESLELPDRLRGLAYRSLRSLPRDSSLTRVRNRCTLTGRSRAIVRRFGLSRLRFRSLALQGKLPGVHKARWLFFPMDTLSSRITTIRNAQRAGRPSVLLTPRQGGGTRLGRSILRLLVREGYIDAFSVYSYTSCAQSPSSIAAPLSNQTTFLVHLKYGSHGQPAFHSIQRVSTPARRVYLSSSALWQPQTGLGLLIVSTPRGVLTDRDARHQGLGGEVLRAI